MRGGFRITTANGVPDFRRGSRAMIRAEKAAKQGVTRRQRKARARLVRLIDQHRPDIRPR